MARANNLKVLATVAAALVAVCLLALGMVLGSPREAQAIGPNAVRAGFNDNTLNRNDDNSTNLVPMGFSQPLNFFDNDYSQLYVNNNGNVTLDQALGTYTPFDLTSTGRVIIAPFFGDVELVQLRIPSSVKVHIYDTADGSLTVRISSPRRTRKFAGR